ncbi:hypothetical protein DEU56DRAFT_782997 [Suillus clintonianus]|uniref:uncharacterized protein n=1 Tax=Suillus clintonianus TaxID=1904413 RepID=UPI001B87CF4B|nr:uncharacterized protein DEU56DRAFT_782997 [Suillus clintonianus]KAG2148946.1 hypothetical protein DEU56DRAFT_782997 [Suillus clintonianus]
MLQSLAPTIATILLVFLVEFTAAGNTTCAGNMTQWYTDAVGETACMTYQRLRQICNPNYEVPNFRQNTPGDQCDDQLQSCCCNSISWALSMLCMNCQWDVNGGSAYGIDAGVGAYGMYRSPSGPFCSPGTNQSLPADIQAAVCNKDIKLGNFLYDLFWSDGPCVYTMNTASKDEAETNNNMYTHCNSTTSTTLSPSASTITTSATPSQTTAAASPGSAHKSNVAIIVGPVIGAIVGLAAAVLVARSCWRKRQQRLVRLSLDTDSPYAHAMAMVSPYTVTDSNTDTISGNPTLYGLEHSRKRGHLPTSSNSFPSNTALVSTTGENGQSLSDSFRNIGSSVSALRHEDAGVVPNLARSGSGRLPPAYDPGWEAPHSETSRLNPDSEFQAEESPSQTAANSEPSPWRTK